MKRIFLLCLLLPLLGWSQDKNVVNANRVFCKVDKVLEFEKALANHAQKYHKGEWNWRVYEIQSGPDAGGYHITEGPTSWASIDGRGNLGDAHNIDWNKNVAIYLTDRGGSSYAVYQDSLSSVALGDFSDKINITHYFPKVGWGGKVYDALKPFQKVWQAGEEAVAVYASSSSGPQQFTLVTRYKQGLKEKAMNFRKPLKDRYDIANGAGAYDKWLEILRNYVDNAWSELLFYRADLSSK